MTKNVVSKSHLILFLILIVLSLLLWLNSLTSTGYKINRAGISFEISQFTNKVYQYRFTDIKQGGIGDSLELFSVNSLSKFVNAKTHNNEILMFQGRYKVLSINDSIMVIAGIGNRSHLWNHPFVLSKVEFNTCEVFITDIIKCKKSDFSDKNIRTFIKVKYGLDIK